MNVENSKDNNIEDVVDTTPLSDVRRTRTKSTGRPPSQHFLKENALQRCMSLECDDLSPEEQENTTKNEEYNGILKNEVTEVIHKAKVDEETIVDGKVNLTRRTSISTIIQPKRVIKEEIPWMNEFRKKREHKRSLLDEEKKSIEEFVRNDDINRKSTATTFESRKFTSYTKSEPDKSISKNEDEIKGEKTADIHKKSEIVKTIEDNLIGRSKMVTNETNFTKHTTSSSISEMHHQFATTTTELTSSKQFMTKKLNIESHSKKPIELPNVNIKEADSSKVETSNAEIIITNSAKVDNQITPPKLPMLIQNPIDDIEIKIEEKKPKKIQHQELISKIKTFEETCNKQLKNIRNEVKVLHRELASLSEFVSEFVKTVEHDIASINNTN